MNSESHFFCNGFTTNSPEIVCWKAPPAIVLMINTPAVID